MVYRLYFFNNKMKAICLLFWLYYMLGLLHLKIANSSNEAVHNDIPLVISVSQLQRQQGVVEDNFGKIIMKRRGQRSLLAAREATNATLNDTISTEEVVTDTPVTPTELVTTEELEQPIELIPRNKAGVTIPQDFCPGKVYSCSNKCSNTTILDQYITTLSYNDSQTCSCDAACNTTFMDCCSDFATTCGKTVHNEKNDVISHKQGWRCVHEVIVIREDCIGSEVAAWMISRCPNNWINNTIREKCHGAKSKLNFEFYDLYVPVTGAEDKLVYRNRYCALCNNASKYELWTLKFQKEAVPPPIYGPKELAKFFNDNLNRFRGVSPIVGQRLRWCHYPNVITKCSNNSHDAREACLNGSVSLVAGVLQMYKNNACALCNGNKLSCSLTDSDLVSCGKDFTDFSSISRAISLQDYGLSTEQACPRDQVYDPYLAKCRNSYKWSNLKLGIKDTYELTLDILTNEHVEISKLKTVFANYFKINDRQLGLKNYSVKDDELSITYTLQLSLPQSLLMATDPDFQEVSNETIGLRRIFKFNQAFRLHFFNESVTIYKLQIRQVTCTRRHSYKYGEYNLLDDLQIHVNSTGITYDQDQYFMLNSTTYNTSISVCLKIKPLWCPDHALIRLNQSEYYFTANLSLVYHSLTYKLGDYLYKNNTSFICVDFKRNYNTYDKEKDDLALVVITWIGFLVSIIFLLALLITYFIFQELRNLPGKNLMSLSSSLCLGEVFWLSGSLIEANTVCCTVIGIANHYFFLVFFTTSSVVAFHSCLVFGKKVNIRRDNSYENKLFRLYSLLAWGFPAIFVLIFSLLDGYGMFNVNYGKSACWLNTKQSKVFLFILPFGIFILFNILLFLLVTVRLHQNQKSSAKFLAEVLNKKRQRQYVFVCIKLSTLMGFSWLFGLLQIATETKTDVFSYLFVLFTSFQGVFIGVAFLIKRSNYKLFIKLIGKKDISEPNCPSNKTVTNQSRCDTAEHETYNTKL